MDHRTYVGGLWDEIGQAQFEFMVGQGLKPEHYFLDAACGSLRAGVHFIPYLEPGHYWGLEKRRKLVQAGIEKELDPAVYASKGPRFVINADFDLSEVPQEISFDYMLAASLFTHLLPEGIERCVAALLLRLADSGRFYAAYLPLDYPGWPQQAIDLDWFGKVVEALGAEYRLVEYVHPRQQRMLCITRKL